jgi:hypothetical protein
MLTRFVAILPNATNSSFGTIENYQIVYQIEYTQYANYTLIIDIVD